MAENIKMVSCFIVVPWSLIPNSRIDSFLFSQIRSFSAKICDILAKLKDRQVLSDLNQRQKTHWLPDFYGSGFFVAYGRLCERKPSAFGTRDAVVRFVGHNDLAKNE
jgi:hypothetical protein